MVFLGVVQHRFLLEELLIVEIVCHTFWETRTKRSVEVCKVQKLPPPPPFSQIVTDIAMETSEAVSDIL